MTLNNASHPAEDLSNQIAQKCIPTIEKSTVALVGIQNEKIVHDRTGVLYRIAGHHFIITASHAGNGGKDLRAYNEHTIDWYVSLNVANVLPILMSGVEIYGTKVEPRDIAVVRLPDSIASQILQHKQFIQQNQVVVVKNWGSGWYILFGYPMEWSHPHETKEYWYSDPLIYLCAPYNGEIPAVANHEPSVHFALSFSREAVEMSDLTPTSLPTPKGISGCGVWLIRGRSHRGSELVSPDRVSLVGIQHTWHEKYGYVRGTRITCVMERILNDFPEVARAMNLLFRR